MISSAYNSSSDPELLSLPGQVVDMTLQRPSESTELTYDSMSDKRLQYRKLIYRLLSFCVPKWTAQEIAMCSFISLRTAGLKDMVSVISLYTPASDIPRVECLEAELEMNSWIPSQLELSWLMFLIDDMHQWTPAMTSLFLLVLPSSVREAYRVQQPYLFGNPDFANPLYDAPSLAQYCLRHMRDCLSTSEPHNNLMSGEYSGQIVQGLKCLSMRLHAISLRHTGPRWDLRSFNLPFFPMSGMPFKKDIS